MGTLSIYKSLDTELVATCDGLYDFRHQGDYRRYRKYGRRARPTRKQVYPRVTAGAWARCCWRAPSQFDSSNTNTSLREINSLEFLFLIYYTWYKLYVHYSTQTRWGDKQRKVRMRLIRLVYSRFACLNSFNSYFTIDTQNKVLPPIWNTAPGSLELSQIRPKAASPYSKHVPLKILHEQKSKEKPPSSHTRTH